MIQTERLILRHWHETDAEQLYQHASNQKISYNSGWPAHQTVSESRKIINEYFQSEYCYAICLAHTGKIVGSIELKFGERAQIIAHDESEIGYWIGEQYWGNGYAVEAVKALIKIAFESLAVNAIWCDYYEGNQQSKRVSEKCGFVAQEMIENYEIPPLNMTRNLYRTKLIKTEWLNQ